MPLSVNNINIYNKPKMQVIRNRFLGFVRKTEHKIISPQNINRTNQFGLAQEQIKFFRGTDKIKNHYRKFFPRKGKPSGSTTVEFSFFDAKKIIRERYKNKLNMSEPVLETSTSNYMPGKKLSSKVREYSGMDKNGEFKSKMTATYDPENNLGTEKPKLISVFNEKRYIKRGHEASSSDHFIKTTILFNEKGNKTYQKIETPTRWKSVEFDEKGIPFNHDSGTPQSAYENYSENLI